MINFNYLERPDQEALEESVQNLKFINAVDKDNKITFLGKIMVQMPTEPIISRAIIEAYF